MSSKKISISRKWLEPVPIVNGKDLPRPEWPKQRRYCWIVRWYETTGKRCGKLFDKKRRAEQFAFAMQQQVNAGEQDELESISIRDFVTEHENIMKNQIKVKTLRSQLRLMCMLGDFLGFNTQISAITPRDAEAFIANRAEKGLALATINHDIRTLKRVLNLAIEPRGYLREGKNPFGKMKQRKLTPKAVRYVSVAEYRALLESSKRLWWKAFISVAYCCGLRRGEIINLTWADIDFINHLVNVKAKEKSQKTLKWEPKTHENRSVPLPDQTLQFLANMQAEAPVDYPYIFVSPSRFQYIKELEQQGKWSELKDIHNNFIRDFAVIRKRASIKKCTIHDLRRSAITNWSQALPIQVVQQFAGHSNITTTRKYYLTVRPEDVKKAGDFINQLITPAK